MKRSELAKGMKVGLRRATNWQTMGVDEAYVLDIVDTYVDYRAYKSTNTRAVFDDPLNPGQTIDYLGRPARSEEHGKMAVLTRQYYGGSAGWAVELVALSSIVGTYDDCKAVVDEIASRAKAAAKRQADHAAANTTVWENLKVQYPALATYRASFDATGKVTLPLDLLAEVLRAAAEKGFAEGYHSHDDHCVGTGECYTDSLNPYAKAE